MKKVVLMFGTPGVGKSTLVWRLFDATGGMDAWPQVEPVQLVRMHVNRKQNLAVIGRYKVGYQYSGVDRLSMAVQPNAEYFIKETTQNVLVEGDRFSNQKFCRFLLGLRDTEVMLLRLVADPRLIRERQVARGDDRDATFLMARETKYDNICFNFPTVRVLRNDTIEEHEVIWRLLQDFLGIQS